MQEKGANFQDNLRKIIDDETRTGLFASENSINECESSMYDSRRRLQPKIPLTEIEFSVVLPESTFATHYKFALTSNNYTAVVFYSQHMKNYPSEISNIQSDGTFYRVCHPNSPNYGRIRQLEQLHKYFKKRWITQINPEELSIYEAEITTNNAAESYYTKLKSIIKTHHPKVWHFLKTLNNKIEDIDNEMGRLRPGHSISRPRKSKHVLNDQQRDVIKEKSRIGELTPWQYPNAMNNTIGGTFTEIEFSDTDESDTSDNESEDRLVENICVICLMQRTTT
ncbi:hypothetical protein LOD99_4731 [Oopsacas minuta]|uniref:Uncharacterized protein n=1 Tax=Oopsacas minuta TaxID=111878 RepID=A0AAV7JSZ3_9METZ|nr:hypothetical protein LOD99_4731 [Oopsacas minuta]